jgi:hypothetical protein
MNFQMMVRDTTKWSSIKWFICQFWPVLYQIQVINNKGAIINKCYTTGETFKDFNKFVVKIDYKKINNLLTS